MIEFWFQILIFTLLQATLSATLSLLIGLGLARFLWRYSGLRFEGILRGWAGVVFVVPMMLPTLGFISLFDNIYGIWGIILVHVFLNTGYCMIQIQGGYQHFLTRTMQRQSIILKLTFWERLYFLEFPLLRTTLSHSFMVVFCIALSSFSVVLLLGGGPSSTTLSVALYQSISISHNMMDASFFIALQLLISLSVAMLLHRIKRTQKEVDVFIQEKERNHTVMWFQEFLLLSIIFIYMIPLWGVFENFTVPTGVFKTALEGVAITLSLGVGIGFLTLSVSLMYLTYYLKQGKILRNTFSIMVSLFFSVPKIALVGGLFLSMHSFLEGVILTYILIIFTSFLCYFPFCLKTLLADFKTLQGRYGSQIILLRLSYIEIIRFILMPHLYHKLKRNFAMITCFAMGNLSVCLLLGQLEVKTLPVLSYQALLRYDTELASFYMACLVVMMVLVYGISSKIKRKKNASASI